MTTTRAVLVACVGLLFSLPAAAHHAVGGEFDPDKPVTVSGVVSKVEWTNPHARIHFDVKEAGGAIASWSVELAARNVLERMGWTIGTLKIGDAITVRGDASRNGAKVINARARERRAIEGGNEKEYAITLADGTPVLNDR